MRRSTGVFVFFEFVAECHAKAAVGRVLTLDQCNATQPASTSKRSPQTSEQPRMTLSSCVPNRSELAEGWCSGCLFILLNTTKNANSGGRVQVACIWLAYCNLRSPSRGREWTRNELVRVALVFSTDRKSVV